MTKAVRKKIGLVGLLLCFVSVALSQEGLNDAQSMCRDMTDKNRAMAQAAGYDVDRLCRGVNSISTDTVIDPSDEIVPPASRRTISSSAKFIKGQIDGELDNPETDSAEDFPWVWNAETESWEEKEEELKPYGYDLFASESNTFAPTTNIPVSADYLLGPGDSLEILLYGKTNESFSIEINRNGVVDFPGLGPVGLAGLTFVEAKEMIRTRVGAQMIGVQASISMGSLRTMQIFVLGEAFRPGAYTVSSLATITNALVSSGGVTDIASLRNIQLKKAGKLVTTLDLYDLLMRGDTSGDIRLQASDVIYIPTVGDVASVSGEVRRPAIYEIKPQTTVQTLIDLAGGLNAKAYANKARIDRVDDNGFMTVVDVSLNNKQSETVLLRAGDHLNIDSAVDYQKNVVSLMGHVHRPGEFSWYPGMRASDLIKTLDQFPPKVDTAFALLVRERTAAGEIETIKVDLQAVLESPGSESDISLRARDKVQVFSIDTSREDDIQETLDSLEAQSRSGGLSKVVSATGAVKFPGRYPLTQDMTLAHLVSAAGGLAEAVYSEVVEVSRVNISGTDRVNQQIYAVNLADEIQLGDSGFKLQPQDSVTFRLLPEFREESKIELRGEVRLPGVYDFARGETLREVIDRAGGFTELAFLEAAVFTRESLRKEEDRQLQKLQEDMVKEFEAKQVKSVGNKAADSRGAEEAKAALEKSFEDTKATGRLVVDLPRIMDGSVADLVLRSGDVLEIPEFRSSVTVIGKVYQPVVFTFDSSLQINDYLAKAGGFTDDADEKAVYVIKASGAVDIPRKGLFSFAGNGGVISPGDTIVVPLETNEALSGLPLFTEASQIIYQLSLGAAALNQLSN
jgi:protein involved in polysaccharide export with SLBB domain